MGKMYKVDKFGNKAPVDDPPGVIVDGDNEQDDHYLAPKIQALFTAETDPKMPRDKRMRIDSINAFFEHQAQWVARNFGDTPGTWQAINHILLARSYVYTASMDKDYTQGWGVRIEELEAKLAESEKFAKNQSIRVDALKYALEQHGDERKIDELEKAFSDTTTVIFDNTLMGAIATEDAANIRQNMELANSLVKGETDGDEMAESST